MEFKNPLLRGLYPDPSVCCKDGTYYLVCSSFEYLPGVPIFASRDLMNWEQIGNVLDRPSQLDLAGVKPSDGVFAPTIRYHEGRYFMITTCATGGRGGDGAAGGRPVLRNFFVTATDPAGPWTDPVEVPVVGIDPSLYWEDGACYVQYAGRGEIFQAQIDDVTGEILDGPRKLTDGCGGRDAEGPHMWVRDGWHYLLLAEGGTREGHRAALMRGGSVWGPFEPCPYGPIMSNADLPRESIQRTGHTDWLVGPDGHDYLVALGVREVRHRSLLGRETMLVPAGWTEDGWLLARDQMLPGAFEIEAPDNVKPMSWDFSLDMTAGEMPLRVVSPRAVNRDCYAFESGVLRVRGNGRGLADGDSCCWAVRQPELDVHVRAVIADACVEAPADEVGLVASITPQNHLSVFVGMRAGKRVLVVRRRVADVCDEQVFPRPAGTLELAMEGDAGEYRFYANGAYLASALSCHVTVENAGTQNTGVVDGLFASGAAKATIEAFEVLTDAGKDA